MSLVIRPNVQQPPAGLLDRFYPQIVSVARVWLYLARFMPIEVTSWYRPEAVNAATSGKTYSQHLVGAAMDALNPQLSREQLLPYVQQVARAFGVTAPSAASETSGRSVHVQGLPTGYLQTLVQREPTLLARADSFVGPPRPIA